MKNFNFFEVNVGDHFGGNLLILIFSSSILVLFDFWCSPPQPGKYLTAATGWTQGPTHWNPCVDQFVVSNVRGGPDGKQCGMDCIGEMARTFKASVSERRRPSSSTSKVSDHLFREHRGHQFQSENVRIPDRKPDWFRRGIKEAIYISQLQPSFNRDGGRYQLLGKQSFEVTALLTFSSFWC